MDTNLFTPVEMLTNTPERVYLEGVHDDYEGFRVIIGGEKDQEGMLRISFNRPLIYRVAQESSITGVPFNELINIWFFKVNKSTYLEWYLEMSSNDHIAEDIEHYCIYTCNYLIDVLSDAEPSIEWLIEPFDV